MTEQRRRAEDVVRTETAPIVRRSNGRLFFYLMIVAVVMLGVAYAFVPLYRMLCQALKIPVPTVLVGEEGAPKNLESSALPVGASFTAVLPSSRTVVVRFMGNRADGVPVTLEPVVKKLTVHLGEPVLTAYRAHSEASRTLTGLAVHTVVAQGNTETPDDVSEYIDLQQCFCFEEQIYPAGEEVTLPLSFAFTKDLPAGIHTVTFNYTLYEAAPDNPIVRRKLEEKKKARVKGLNAK